MTGLFPMVAEAGLAILAIAAAYLLFGSTGLVWELDSLTLVLLSTGTWAGAQIQSTRRTFSRIGLLIQLMVFCLGTTLLVEGAAGYVFQQSPAEARVMLSGSLMAAGLIAAFRTLRQPQAAPGRGVLLVGFDSLTQEILERVNSPVLGAVATGNGQALPPGVPLLGDATQLGKAVAQLQPDWILVSPSAWQENVAPRQLLDLRQGRMRLEYAPAVFEDLFHRVRLERTGDLSKLLDRLSASSLIMAIQAVYTNLVGLALGLLLTVPMLIVILAIAIFGGPGPVFEEVECLGFQRIPFQRLRFRTSRRDGHPGRTAIGSLIRALRIEGLPQIINVIRGEMALIGPRPVRAEFALRLTEWMPLYAYRFGVKPGMVGWSQVNETGNLPLEPLTTEFDLFYIKQATPLMDLEILLRYLLRPRSRG